MEVAAREVLLKVGIALERGWRFEGRRREGWVIVEYEYLSYTCWLLSVTWLERKLDVDETKDI